MALSDTDQGQAHGPQPPVLPSLAAGPHQLDAFRAYLEAFSAGDLERFPAWYAENIVFDLGVAPPFHGKAAVVEFYRGVFATLREQVTLEAFEADGDTIRARISVLFTAFRDTPDFVLAPLSAGQSLTGRFDVVYGLREGLVATVKVAMIGPPS